MLITSRALRAIIAAVFCLFALAGLVLAVACVTGCRLLLPQEPGPARETDNNVGTVDPWLFVTAIYHGAQHGVILDGASRGCVSRNEPLAVDDNVIHIVGNANDDSLVPSEVINGALDEVRLPRVARSTDWIAADHATSTGAVTTLLAAVAAP